MRVVIRSFFSLRIISKVFFFFFQAWKAMAGEEDIIPGGRFVLDSAKLTVPFAVHARERSRSVISAVCTSEKKRTLSLFSSSSVERNRGGKNSGARLEVDDVLLPLLPFLLSSPLSSPSPFLLMRLSQESSTRDRPGRLHLLARRRTRTDSGKRLYRKHGGDPSVPRVNIPRLSFMYRRWRYIVVKAGDAPGVISIIRFTTFFAFPPPLSFLFLFEL